MGRYNALPINLTPGALMPDNNLLHKIRAAQVNVGEQMVLDDLRRRGLLDSPVFECPDCGKDIAEGGAQPHDCRPAPAQSVEGEDVSLIDRLRKQAVCVYLAAEEGPAKDLSDGLTKAADRIATLTKELAEARKVIDSQQASRS